MRLTLTLTPSVTNTNRFTIGSFWAWVVYFLRAKCSRCTHFFNKQPKFWPAEPQIFENQSNFVSNCRASNRKFLATWAFCILPYFCLFQPKIAKNKFFPPCVSRDFWIGNAFDRSLIFFTALFIILSCSKAVPTLWHQTLCVVFECVSQCILSTVFSWGVNRSLLEFHIHDIQRDFNGRMSNDSSTFNKRIVKVTNHRTAREAGQFIRVLFLDQVESWNIVGIKLYVSFWTWGNVPNRHRTDIHRNSCAHWVCVCVFGLGASVINFQFQFVSRSEFCFTVF